MNIKFDWIHTSVDMPEKNQVIFALYRDNAVIQGKFKGKDYVWNYGKDNPVLGLIGRQLLFKQTVSFGPQVIYDLPLTGFFWAKPSINFNLPEPI